MNPEKPEGRAGSAGSRVREVCRLLGMTQKELAEAFCRSPQYITEVVRGRNRVTEDLATWLAKTYNVNLNWLMTGNGPPLLGRAADGEPAYDALSDVALLREVAERIGAGRRLAVRLEHVEQRLVDLESGKSPGAEDEEHGNDR